MKEFKSSSIKTIIINSNCLDDNCIQSLGELLADNESIEDIFLGGNMITDKGINILMTYLLRNKNLKNLNLSKNKGITNASIKALKDIIFETNIEGLDLSGASVSNQEIILMASLLGLKYNKTRRISLFRRYAFHFFIFSSLIKF